MNLANQVKTTQIPISMATTFLTKKTVVSDPPEPALNPPPTASQTSFVQ